MLKFKQDSSNKKTINKDRMAIAKDQMAKVTKVANHKA